MKINKLLPLVFLIGTNIPTLCNALKQPNLIVYMIDDLGWNQISAKQVTMGTHTGSFITPNIEKIANIVFVIALQSSGDINILF